jgi:hypothetical protein
VSVREAVSATLRRLHLVGRRPRSRDDTPTAAIHPPTPSIGGELVVEYAPCLDGDPDPGEVVWTWVSYEDDPTQGKDRPVIILGRRGTRLVAISLTSKRHDGELPVGSGPWDSQGRPSYAKVDRLLEVDPANVRREGAILDRRRFDDVVAAVRRGTRNR